MADLSSIFAPPRTTRRSNVFDLQNEYAAQFKRKIVMREAMKQDLAPEDGDDFFQFVGNRLAQLGDAEGALAVQEQRNQFAASQAAAQQQAFDNALKVRELQRKIKKDEADANPQPFQTITGPEAEALGLPGDGVYQVNPKTNKVTVLERSQLLTPEELDQQIEIAAKQGAEAARLSADRAAGAIEGARGPLGADLQASTDEIVKFIDGFDFSVANVTTARRGQYFAAVDDFATALAGARNLRGEPADALKKDVRALFPDPADPTATPEAVKAIIAQAVARFRTEINDPSQTPVPEVDFTQMSNEQIKRWIEANE